MPSLEALAYQVQPISVSLEATGRNSSRDVKIINGGSAPVAIQISMVSRQQNIDGSDRTQAAGSKFVVYPENMVIKPKSAQSVRIQWLGNPHVATEESYRFIIKQVPVKLRYANEAKNSLDFHLTMEGALYIRPENAKSDIIVSSSNIQGKQLDIVFSNKGTSHSLLKNIILTLRQGSRTVNLRGKQIYQIEGKNVLAGARRRFSIPLPAGIQAGQPVSASLKYSETVSH